jgi:hypothetical protein
MEMKLFWTDWKYSKTIRQSARAPRTTRNAALAEREWMLIYKKNEKSAAVLEKRRLAGAKKCVNAPRSSSFAFLGRSPGCNQILLPLFTLQIEV